MASPAQPFSEVDSDQESASNQWDSDTDSTPAAAACSRELPPGEGASPPLEAASSSFSIPKYSPRGERDGAHHVKLSFREGRLSQESQEDQIEGKEGTGNWGVQNGGDVDLEKGLNFNRGGGDHQDGQQTEDEEEEEEDEEGRGCRVCHLAVHSNSMAGEAIELGCECKEDLAMAHRHCAEAWFKIKGNRTCEICGSIAQNVEGIENVNFMDHWNERDANTSAPNEPPTRCWQSQPLCNILLACMLLAFILPWLFRVSLF